MFFHSGEEKVRLLLNLDLVLDLHVLFLTKHVCKVEQSWASKMGKIWHFFTRLVSSQSVPTVCSDEYRGPWGLFLFPGCLCWCFVQICLVYLCFSVMGLLSLVMLGCVEWVISGKGREKLGRNCEQDEVRGEARAEQTHTCEAGTFLLLQLMSEGTFERGIIDKTEPNSSQRCTRDEQVATSCSKGISGCI